jgi:hypothetical protein
LCWVFSRSSLQLFARLALNHDLPDFCLFSN